MPILILGLTLFLGVHSTRLLAEGWRARQIERFGLMGWKGIYTLLSGLGLALTVWGFGLARTTPVALYLPPPWLHLITILLMIPAFLLLAATYVPRNSVKAALGHPMLLSVKLWAFAHLLANGRVADLVLFGGFLVWAVASFAGARRRDRRDGVTYAAGTTRGNALMLLAGLVAWALFAFALHVWITGVAPLQEW
jgi:uncharacterized membrane protein